jgi:hypothetical protein
MTGLFDRLMARSDDRLSDSDFVQARRPSRFEDDGLPVSSTGLEVVDEPVETRAKKDPASPPPRRTGSLAFAAPVGEEAMEDGGETAITAGPPSREGRDAMAGPGHRRAEPAKGPGPVAAPVDRRPNRPSPATGVSADARPAQRSRRGPGRGQPALPVETTGRSTRPVGPVSAGPDGGTIAPMAPPSAIDGVEPNVGAARPPAGETQAERPPAPSVDTRRPSPVSIRIGRIDVRSAPAPAPRPAPVPTHRRGSPLTDYLGWKGR